jgi:hypothetical protein
MCLEFANLSSIFSNREWFCKSHGCIFPITDPFSRIQPAGCIHEVYTPISTLVAGGHFLCLDMMHMTEMTRSFHHFRVLSVTNADHEAVVNTLARMLLALSIFDDLGDAESLCLYTFMLRVDTVIPLRCLLALVLQNVVAEEYLPQVEGKLKFPAVVQAQVEAAKYVGRRVLKCLKLTDRGTSDCGRGWGRVGSVR